jgi:hypothetical protein
MFGGFRRGERRSPANAGERKRVDMGWWDRVIFIAGVVLVLMLAQRLLGRTPLGVRRSVERMPPTNFFSRPTGARKLSLGMDIL